MILDLDVFRRVGTLEQFPERAQRGTLVDNILKLDAVVMDLALSGSGNEDQQLFTVGGKSRNEILFKGTGPELCRDIFASGTSVSNTAMIALGVIVEVLLVCA